MPFDPFNIVRNLESRMPKLSRRVAIRLLGWMSPFNNRLKTRLLEWTDHKVVIALKRSRGVRNHVGSIHAGAQFTLGETCAGLVIIRNFPFGHFRPLMSDVRVTYSKQARGDVIGECVLLKEQIDTIHETIAKGEVPTVEMITHIKNLDDEIITVVKTIWQIKPWGLVRSKN